MLKRNNHKFALSIFLVIYIKHNLETLQGARKIFELPIYPGLTV